MDNHTVLNRLVESAAAVMANRAESTRLLSNIFRDKGTAEGNLEADRLAKMADTIEAAVKTMHEYSGGWA